MKKIATNWEAKVMQNKWDLQTERLVVGYGLAGGVAASKAAQVGPRALYQAKMQGEIG